MTPLWKSSTIQTKEPGTPPLQVWVESVTFSDNTVVDLQPDDVLVIVGPNNVGKSAALRDIVYLLEDKAGEPPVITDLRLHKTGSLRALEASLEDLATPTTISDIPGFRHMEATVLRSSLPHDWAKIHRLGELTPFFVRLLKGEQRLSGSSRVDNVGFRSPAKHPIHHALRNDSFEASLSTAFRAAFGIELILDRAGGKDIGFVVGNRPTLAPGEDRTTASYQEKVYRLPLLDDQGDGMRSFATILLHTAAGPESVVMVDEPEAFMHPPQARLLGKMLTHNKPSGRQLLIATHSGDVLRGVLDANSPKVRVIRLTRERDINRIHLLDSADVAEVWGDSLLRYSNVLDGIFHEKVVISESDSDSRFYAGVLAAIQDQNGSPGQRDIMFTSCGGTARMPLVIRSLRALGVDVACVVDFDVLREREPLKSIVDAAGGDWLDVEKEWKSVKASVDGKRAELNSSEVKREVQNVMDSVTQPHFPDDAKGKLTDIFRRASPWASVKLAGAAFVPSGEPSAAYARLADKLRAIQVHVVEVGEVERFVKTIDLHGPAWVAKVFETRSIATDPEMAVAKAFVRQVCGAPESPLNKQEVG